MISKITINDYKNVPIKWWSKIESLSTIKELTFTRGLNIFWGKNGSGKSSILRLIAKMFHAEQGRYSFVSSESMSELFGFSSAKKDTTNTVLNSVSIEHDNQGLMYFDPDHRPGLIGGMAGFDYDFMDAGMSSIFSKGSSGQLNVHNVSSLLTNIKEAKPTQPVYKVSSKYDKRVDKVKEFFKGSLPDGPPTFLLDEMDRSVDMPYQLGLWRFLQEKSKTCQIIVASHSPFAVEVAGANYIEFSPGYLNACKQSIKNMNELSGFEGALRTGVMTKPG